MTRQKQIVRLTVAERAQLKRWARRAESSRIALRPRIILACADGASNVEIARRLSVSLPTVLKWRKRFLDSGLEGLLDAARPGRPKVLTDSDVRKVLAKVKAGPDKGARWTTRSLARATGLSQNAVWRIGQRLGIAFGKDSERKEIKQSRARRRALGARTNPLREGEEKAGTGKRRILEAALVHFASFGYHGASTIEIAREAGVTQPLVHRHYFSKAKLWEACVDHALERTIGYVADLISEADVSNLSVEDSLRRILRQFAASAFEAVPLARIFNSEAGQGGPRLDYLVVRIQPTLDIFMDLLRTGKDEKLIRNIPSEYLLAAWLGIANHLFILGEFAKSQWGIDATADEHIQGYRDAAIRVYLDGILNRK